MSRRRWLYTSQGQALPAPVELTADWVQPGRGPNLKSEEEIYGKLGVATDGTDISTRTKHREYMKRNGLTVAEDFKGVWAEAEKYRERVGQGDFDHARRRETIGRAAYELEKKGRK